MLCIVEFGMPFYGIDDGRIKCLFFFFPFFGLRECIWNFQRYIAGKYSLWKMHLLFGFLGSPYGVGALQQVKSSVGSHFLLCFEASIVESFQLPIL